MSLEQLMQLVLPADPVQQQNPQNHQSYCKSCQSFYLPHTHDQIQCYIDKQRQIQNVMLMNNNITNNNQSVHNNNNVTEVIDYGLSANNNNNNNINIINTNISNTINNMNNHSNRSQITHMNHQQPQPQYLPTLEEGELPQSDFSTHNSTISSINQLPTPPPSLIVNTTYHKHDIVRYNGHSAQIMSIQVGRPRYARLIK